MAYSFTQLEDIKTRVVRDLAAQQTQIESARGAFAAAESALTQMQSTYSTWAQEINAMATANPSDAAVVALKAFKDRVLTEFTSTKTLATNLKNAVTG